eukprot:3682710-Prymnesium_polylepis.1
MPWCPTSRRRTVASSPRTPLTPCSAASRASTCSTLARWRCPLCSWLSSRTSSRQACRDRTEGRPPDSRYRSCCADRRCGAESELDP